MNYLIKFWKCQKILYLCKTFENTTLNITINYLLLKFWTETRYDDWFREFCKYFSSTKQE